MANIYTGSRTEPLDGRKRTEDREGRLGLSIEEIVRGQIWSIVRTRLSVPSAVPRPATLRFDCGVGQVVVPLEAEAADRLELDLLFRSDDLAGASQIAIAHEPGGLTARGELRGVPAWQADAMIEVDAATDGLAGHFVDLCAEVPGGVARVRFFGALDVDFDLEPAGRPLWAASGRVARRFDFKRNVLLQCLRGIDPDFERLWPKAPVVAFLGTHGTILRQLPFTPPRPVDGAIETITAQLISGHLVSKGTRQPYDIFVNDVRYHSDLTEKNGRFSFVPPHPGTGEEGVDITVAASFTRAMLPVEVAETAVELPPAEALPAGDWSWIAPSVLVARKVSVIIPVYNAPIDLARCLRSVLTNFAGISRLIVIDDCSPDSRILEVLSVFRGSRMEVHRNSENLGFTRTVNRGIDLAAGDDVILLNSDTVVPPGWVGSLKTAAYCGPWVATATPLSNNAGAFSVPEFGVVNALPENLSVDACARLYRAASVGAYPRVPTGNGFCMYIRRDCLDIIGKFDEAAFPVGYGEENDLCMRAVRAGFEHVIDDRTFVFHARSASFGKAKTSLYAAGRAVIRERYPEYDELISVFSDGAPMLGVRWRIRDAILRHRAAPRSPGRSVAVAVSAESSLEGLGQDTGDGFAPHDRRLALVGGDDGVSMWEWNTEHWECREKRELPKTTPTVFKERTKVFEGAVQQLLVRYAVDVLIIRDFGRPSTNLPEIADALGISVHF